MNRCYWILKSGEQCLNNAVFDVGRGPTPGKFVGACRRHVAQVVEDRLISELKVTVVRGRGFYV